jgi:glycosyltransferase involved in cell wall biosynthesis
VAEPRIAFVVHRYGRGGAEMLCQRVAERLAARGRDVTVLTTCALDHKTWANHFPPGETIESGVRILRFPTTEQRDPKFDSMPMSDELGWLRAQGPHAPRLLDHIRLRDHDAYFFVTYLYEPTVLGLPMVADRAALIPTAHDEPPIRLSIYRDVFASPRWLIFLSPAEQRFVQALFQNRDVPSSLCSWGLDQPASADPNSFRRTHAIKGDLLVYIGRVETSKGCRDLVDWARGAYRRRPFTLALIGQNVLGVKAEPGILPLGFVDDAEKHAALAAADLFLMPSAYESFSIACLEAWQHGIPVIGNARSEVVTDHIRASQGGLYYDGQAELSACVAHLLDRPTLRQSLGQNGRRYVAANYDWARVDTVYDRVIAHLTGGSIGVS